MPSPTDLLLSFDTDGILESHSPSDLTFSFGTVTSVCSQLRDDETTTVDFTCDCANPKKTTNNFAIDCSGIADVFSEMHAYVGENVRSPFENVFKFNSYHGEQSSAILSAFSQTNFAPRPYYGEQGNVVIAYTYQFVFASNFDSRLQCSLSTYPAVLFSPTGLYGEEGTFKLSPVYQFVMSTNSDNRMQFDFTPTYGSTFSPIASVGENGNLILGYTYQFDMSSNSDNRFQCDLSTYPPARFTMTGYHGEEGIYQLSRTAAFVPSGYYGEQGNLVYNNSFNVSFDGYHGEQVVAPLTAVGPPLLNFTGFQGERGAAGLSTQLLIGANAYAGDQGSMALTIKINNPMILTSSSGSLATITRIVTHSSVPSPAYVGENAVLVLNTRPSVGMFITAYHGETKEIKLAVTNAFKPLVYVGENSSAILGNLPFWKSFTGEVGTFDLVTTTIITSSSYSGDYASLVLIVPPPPTFRMSGYVGDAVIAPLKTLISHSFIMYTTMELYYHDNTISQLHIDLNTNSCCPTCNPYELKHIEMNREPIYAVSYAPGSMDINANLIFTTQPRFKFSAFAGENVALTDHSVYMSFNGYVGETTKTRDLHTLLNIELGLGNFLPVGDNIDIELTKAPDPTVYRQAAYMGEWAGFELSVKRTVTQHSYYGEGLTMNLTTHPPFRFFGYHGEEMHMNMTGTPHIAPVGYDGTTFRIAFYELPWIIGYGEAASLTLTTTYDVMFTESDELANNYVPINENGDPIVNPTQGKAMEGTQYTHYITGICL